MRRLIVVLVALAALLAGCSASHSAPSLTLVPVHSTVEAKFRFTPPPSCISPDCGAYAETLSWGTIPFASTTGFNVFINGSKIADVTSSPYTFTGLDCGTTFTLGVQAHDGSGDVGQTYSEPYTTPPCSPPPINSTLPTIGGTPQTGSVLTATNGTWLNSPTAFTYQWERCASSCTNISTATASTYTPVSADVGDTIQVAVTATNAFGNALATSAPTGVVSVPSGAPEPLLLSGASGAPANTINWSLVNDDEFNNTSINTCSGSTGLPSGCQWILEGSTDGDNGGKADPANCSEGTAQGAGALILQNNQTAVTTCDIESAFGPYAGGTTSPQALTLPVGGFVEFRMWYPQLPGNNNNPCANWGAVWARSTGSGFGEIDVAECGTKLEVNYHCPANTGGCPSTGAVQVATPLPLLSWENSWHTYGVYRSATNYYVYWDGKLVATQPLLGETPTTMDVRITMGIQPGGAQNNLVGSAGDMLVDYARQWSGG